MLVVTKKFICQFGILFLILPFSLPAQVNPNAKKNLPDYSYTVGGNLLSGFMIKHDDEMGHLSQGSTKGFEVFVNKNTYGKTAWEQVFKFPDLGISLGYYDYGSEILGKSIGLFFYSDFIIARTKRFEGLFKIGSGFAYHTNPYDRIENNKNIAVGSSFTQNMQLRLGLNYKISDQLKFTGAVTATHFSFAAFVQPNKGANVVSFNSGFSYRLNKEVPDYQYNTDSFIYDKSLKYNLSFSYFVKEIPPIGGPKYPVFVLSYYMSKQVSNTNILNAGIDGFNNTAVKEEIRRNKEINQEDSPDHKRIGLTLGHELKLNNVSLLTQLGVYLYRPYKTDQPVYQRYALKFYLTDNVFLHWGFLTHYAKADHVELGLGITL